MRAKGDDKRVAHKRTGRELAFAVLHDAGRQVAPDRLALKPYWGKPAVRKCVQRRLARSVGDKPTEATVSSLVAWILGRKETELPKRIDKVIQGMASESSGRNESERRNGLETEAPEAEPSFMRRRQHGSSQTD